MPAASRLSLRLMLGMVASGLALLAVASTASGAPGLRVGFADPAYSGSTAERAALVERSRAARASVARVFGGWAQVAPQPPPDSATARDPGWGGYRWWVLDAAVRDVAGGGLDPLVSFADVPPWAEGPGRPAISNRAPARTWRPSPTAYRDFAAAAARRYSGSFPDPERPGATLPRVRFWQAWNEPNIPTYMSPQWTRRKGKTAPESPRVYRALLNGFYDGVKSVSRTNYVVSAGLSPFGDRAVGGLRIPPALFNRELLCVSGRARPKAGRCSGTRPHFDALAHHPYSFGPTTPARSPDNVATIDLAKLTKPLAVALRAGNVLPRRPKQLWITEVSYDSAPPDPGAYSEARQATFLEATLYQLWRQGADVVTWFRVRDEAEGRGYEYTLQSGVFFRGPTLAEDRPKQSFTAFRFPFTAYVERGVPRLWGMAPTGGQTVRIEAQRRGGAWRSVKTMRAGGNRIFVGPMRASRGTLLRARQGDEVSLNWEVGRSPLDVRGESE